MKKNANATIFAIAIVIASIVLGNAFMNRNKKDGLISVTGLGEANFTSDLIVWEGSFSTQSFDLKQSFKDLERDKEIITDYLVSKGVLKEELVFYSVETNEKRKSKYSPDGDYMGDEFLGYALTQALKIESKDVEKVEKVSREITALLNRGIRFYSGPPRYYYTRLADLKLEMISKATGDARLRAEKIAEHSGGELGKLTSAKMGIFQITGQNSVEDYSWGGTFNTSSKEKTASITMKLNYETN